MSDTGSKSASEPSDSPRAANRRIRIVKTPGDQKIVRGMTDAGLSGSLPDAALAFGRAGLKVVPCNSHALDGKKSPLIGNGSKGASSDLEQIARWWGSWPDAMIGVMLPEDVVVVDVDPRNGGTNDAVERAIGPLPVTLTVYSGRGDGGSHRYYRRPTSSMRKNLRDVPGVDFLTSGYVIAPPSTHPTTGQPYTLDIPPGIESLPALPDRAVSVLTNETSGPPVRPPSNGAKHDLVMTRARFLSLLMALRDAGEGLRNTTLYSVTCRFVEVSAADPVFDLEGHLEVLTLVAAMAGLDDDEIARTIQSARKGATL